MRLAGLLLRMALLLAMFAGVGFWSAHRVLLHAKAQGKPEYEVRLASYTAGLFLGGSAASLTGVLMLLSAKRGGRVR